MEDFHSLKSIYFFCWAFSFVLFTVPVVKNVQSKLSPQNHFITKHILFLKQIHQLSWFINTLHMACSIVLTISYKINQENVQKSLFKVIFIFMKFQTPSIFYPP